MVGDDIVGSPGAQGDVPVPPDQLDLDEINWDSSEEAAEAARAAAEGQEEDEDEEGQGGDDVDMVNGAPLTTAAAPEEGVPGQGTVNPGEPVAQAQEAQPTQTGGSLIRKPNQAVGAARTRRPPLRIMDPRTTYMVRSGTGVPMPVDIRNVDQVQGLVHIGNETIGRTDNNAAALAQSAQAHLAANPQAQEVLFHYAAVPSGLATMQTRTSAEFGHQLQGAMRSGDTAASREVKATKHLKHSLENQESFRKRRAIEAPPAQRQIDAGPRANAEPFRVPAPVFYEPAAQGAPAAGPPVQAQGQAQAQVQAQAPPAPAQPQAGGRNHQGHGGMNYGTGANNWFGGNFWDNGHNLGGGSIGGHGNGHAGSHGGKNKNKKKRRRNGGGGGGRGGGRQGGHHGGRGGHNGPRGGNNPGSNNGAPQYHNGAHQFGFGPQFGPNFATGFVQEIIRGVAAIQSQNSQNPFAQAPPAVAAVPAAATPAQQPTTPAAPRTQAQGGPSGVLPVGQNEAHEPDTVWKMTVPE